MIEKEKVTKALKVCSSFFCVFGEKELLGFSVFVILN